MKLIIVILLFCPTVIFAQHGRVGIDALVTPKKKPRVITVGGTTAAIPGYTNESIQIAIDALPEEGGTVKLNPGVYSISAPVVLRSNVILIGSGNETILKRVDGFRSKLKLDAGYGELKVTVENSSGFQVGMSIQLKDDDNAKCWAVSTALITDIEGNTLYFDKHLVRNYDILKNAWATNAGSGVLVENAENVHISGFTIEGNKDKNDLLDGCNGGGIGIFKSKLVTVDNVVVNNFNGEGITWQITENVTVRNSIINGCTVMGLHPGAGSPYTIIENNKVSNNKIGVYLCWRVQNSIVKSNEIFNNSQFGISTGHKDSDVIFEKNTVFENGLSGIELREETSKNSPHRTTFIKNIIENNGLRKDGYGFFIMGNSVDVVIADNIIRDTKTGTQKAGIFLGKNTPPVKLENNTMSGHKLGNVIHEE